MLWRFWIGWGRVIAEEEIITCICNMYVMKYTPVFGKLFNCTASIVWFTAISVDC